MFYACGQASPAECVADEFTRPARIGAEDEIRNRDPRLGKAMRYRCATSARRTPMIANTTRKGKTTEAVILSLLVQHGKSVLIPWGEERYDLALDEGGRLVRIQ